MKKNLYPFFLATLVGISISIAGCSQNQDNTDKLLLAHKSQAEAYLLSGQYRAVIIEAKNILALQPEKELGYLLIARSYNELGLYKQAISILEQLPKTTEKTTPFQIEQGRAFIGAQKFRSALDLLKPIDTNSLAPSKRHQIQLEIARAYSGLAEYESAVDIYNAILDEDQNNAGAIIGLAEVAFQRNQLAESEKLVGTLPSSDEYHVEAQLLLAQQKLKAGNLALAEKHLTEALSASKQTDMMTRKRAFILNALSEVLIKQGRSAEALVYTQLLADAFPGYELAQTNYQQALEHFRDGETEKAKTILAELVENYPGFEDAGRLLAVIQYQDGDFRKAAEKLNVVIDPELATTDATLLAAASNLQSNQPDRVIELLKGAPGLRDDSRLLAVYGSALIATGNGPAGVDALELAHAKDPSHIGILSALTSYYLHLPTPDIEQALRYAESAYKKNTSSVTFTTLYVDLLVRSGAKERAKKAVSSLLTHTSNGDTHLLAGKLHFMLGEWPTAQQHFEQALGFNPDLYTAAIGLGDIARQQKKSNSQLLDAYKKAIAIAPSKPEAYQRLIAVAAQSEDKKTAIDSITRQITALQQQLNESTGYIVLANYHSSQGNTQLAEQLLAKAVGQNAPQEALEKANANLYIAQARTARQANDNEAAKKHLFDALKLQPQSPPLLGMLVELEIDTGDFAEANSIIKRIRNLDENLALALDAYSQDKQRNTEKAIALYQKLWRQLPSDTTGARLFELLEQKQRGSNISFATEWLNTFPHSIRANRAISSTLIIQGKLNAAVGPLQKLNQLQPNDPATLNNLAWVYLETGRPSAQKTAEQAVQLAPENAQILDTYGWILLKNYQLEQAVEVLSKANLLDPENKEIASHLASAQKALNEKN